MAKADLVFIPAPGMGHLASMVECAKRLLDLDSRLSITFLLIKPLATSVDKYIASLAASDSRIRYIQLPNVDPPPQELLFSAEKFVTVYVDSYKAHVKDTMIDLISSDKFQVVGFVIDMFCTAMIDVANELNIPSYLFSTSGAGFLGFLLHLPTRHDQVGTAFKQSDPDSIIPGFVNPVPAAVLPGFAFIEDGGYSSFLGHARKYKETKGILLNTFDELEPHAFKCLLDDDQMPPIYTVGPMLDLKGLNSLEADRNKIMKWLDYQPPSSVVFLCFGSLGCFDATQIKEMSIGLERSGHRFLWSVRQPAPKGKLEMPSDYNNLEEILPEGFVERTGGRGMVCGWAPQVEVLAHKAVGGFVSHCGWNSILESLWNGVPIATWPIYAEQQLNAFQLVRDLGLAVELKIDYRMGNEVVKGEEIERAIRSLMESGSEVKKRAKEMGEKSRIAMMDGGSSVTSFGCFLKDVLGNKSS